MARRKVAEPDAPTAAVRRVTQRDWDRAEKEVDRVHTHTLSTGEVEKWTLLDNSDHGGSSDPATDRFFKIAARAGGRVGDPKRNTRSGPPTERTREPD